MGGCSRESAMVYRAEPNLAFGNGLRPGSARYGGQGCSEQIFRAGPGGRRWVAPSRHGARAPSGGV